MAIDLEVLRKSLSDARAQTDPDPLRIAEAAEALGDALETRGSVAEILSLRQEVAEVFDHHLGQVHPRTQAALNNFARALAVAGQLDDAEAIYRAVGTLNETLYGQAVRTLLST